MKCILLPLSMLVLFTFGSYGQVGIGTVHPDPSSILDIQSTESGVLIPRVSLSNTLDNTSITHGNVESLLIYNTNTVSDVTPGFYYWDGIEWLRLLTDASDKTGWATTGNLETINGTHFIGTLDNQNLDIRVNNIIRQRITSKGQLEILNTGKSIFIGEDAGNNDNLNDNQNVFVGYKSGENSSVGKENSFFGFQSGSKNVAGNGNSFFGMNSGVSNNFGYSNSFYGKNSGYSNDFGIENCFFGLDSGYANTKGFENSFFGSGSGDSNQDGFFNCFYGSDSGAANTDGIKNSYYGAGSGLWATGYGNVFIGYNAGSNEIHGNNLLYIENSSSLTPLIWGDFHSNKVGINRSAVTNTLEVGGTASKATPGDWLANSDARLKKNIIALNAEESLAKLLALQGVTYEWNDNVTENQRPKGIQYGFTAQNIQKIYPTLVTKDNQGFLQTSYGTFDAMTVEAIRALHNKLDQLTQANKKLEDRLEALEKIVFDNP